MRHPDAENIIRNCKAALPSVLEAAGVPTTTGLRRDEEGWVNVCWLGEDIVVRFNARDPQLPKFQREEWAYQSLRDHGFPVPRMIAHIDDSHVAPYPVMVVERLPGENLEATWKTLSLEQRERLTVQSAKWLARLHKLPFTQFGEVFRPAAATQREFWADRIEGSVAACDGLFNGSDFERIDSAIQAALPLLDDVQSAWFVHGDYHFGNLLHDGDDVVGVLDFEWAMASDPVIDRAEWSVLDWGAPGARPVFDEAYFLEYGSVSDDPRLLGLYSLSRDLTLVDVSARFLSRNEPQGNVEATLVELSRLEQLL